MRILVLDGSRVLPELVRKLAPPGVVVETASSYDDVAMRFCQSPPDAVIIDLAPARLPWSELLESCQAQSPPIPVLFESCVYRSLEDAGISDPGEGVSFLCKPYPLQDLRDQIERMCGRAESSAA